MLDYLNDAGIKFRPEQLNTIRWKVEKDYKGFRERYVGFALQFKSWQSFRKDIYKNKFVEIGKEQFKNELKETFNIVEVRKHNDFFKLIIAMTI